MNNARNRNRQWNLKGIRCVHWGCALTAALALAGSCAAGVYRLADNGLPLRWNIDRYDPDLAPDQNPVTLALRYHLMASGWSAANRGKELDAVRAAFAQWQSVPGCRIKFEEASTVGPVSDVDSNDFKNTVVWLSGNRLINQGHTFLGATSTGITVLTGSVTDEYIAEADIVLNASLEWTTDLDSTSGSAFSVESVALHEIGHLLGLNHSPAGGSTLFFTTATGSSSTAGLSLDDTTAILSQYGDPVVLRQRSTLKGSVLVGSTPVLGAIVTLEDGSGALVASTVSRANGAYELVGLPPGPGVVRVTPLDPAGPSRLVGGAELDTSERLEYQNANTGFLPVPDQPITLTAGGTLVKNFTVTNGVPPFRIGKTRLALTPSDRTSGSYTVQLNPGQTNAWVGVYVPNFTASSAQLRITGGGLTIGTVVVVPNALAGMALIQAPVDVALNATPGIRSISITAAGYTAWANGFLEVLPAFPDFNFDGLDDRFQRRYWSPFTRAESAPNADPDGDGFANRREYVMGSDPTSNASVNYRITRVKLDATGTTVTWECAPGRKYQVYRRSSLGGAITWIPVGAPVTASGETAQLLDTTPAETLGFYQIRDAQ